MGFFERVASYLDELGGIRVDLCTPFSSLVGSLQGGACEEFRSTVFNEESVLVCNHEAHLECGSWKRAAVVELWVREVSFLGAGDKIVDLTRLLIALGGALGPILADWIRGGE